MNARKIPSLLIIFGGCIIIIGHLETRTSPIGGLLIVLGGAGLLACNWRSK